MNRFPSPILRVAFEGPDLREETLYELLRVCTSLSPAPQTYSHLLQPYGRMQDISQPAPPTVAGGLRFSTVTFNRLRSAAIAHNSVHGLAVQPPTSSAKTILRTTYQAPVQAHVVRDYITSHPRIFLPVLFFLLGTLTYTVSASYIGLLGHAGVLTGLKIFDPIRVLFVEGTLEGWFDIKRMLLSLWSLVVLTHGPVEFQAYQWLRNTALPKFSLTATADGETTRAPAQDVWKERKDAETALERYLNDLPSICHCFRRKFP